MSTEALARIETALTAAAQAIRAYTPGRIAHEKKTGGDPVTEADLLLDRILKQHLLRDDEGWLSEETQDDLSRLDKKHVWIVDPLDGTREFIEGIPEWCISVACVLNGRPQAAGICNPATGQTFLGSRDEGITLNGKSVRIGSRTNLNGACVLASRSEVRRGEWQRCQTFGFNIVPMGSVAYKLACVAAGLADLTFTLVPKNEWDVAAGWLLVEAAGGLVLTKENQPRLFNQHNPLLEGLYAGNAELVKDVVARLGDY
jgi:myo-inositol-1(or 4)-monophosphatase